MALDGEEFAPLFLDPCDVAAALRLIRSTHRGRAVRVVAVPPQSSSS